MQVIGYLSAALIGVSLGLIGGGGSILTVPVMVYLFGINPLLATSYSLFIVGTTSLAGALNQFRQGLINLKAAAFFGTTSMLTVFLTRKLIIPMIPENLIQFGTFQITFPFLTMVSFGLLMVIASIQMIRSAPKNIDIENADCTDCMRFTKLSAYGLVIGLITGFLGAGGGFLLIPAMVLFLKLPMKNAVATSLLIIALNSIIGFAGDLGQADINWTFLLTISAIATSGIFVGSLMSKQIQPAKLKIGFGWFVLIMGLFIIINESLHVSV